MKNWAWILVALVLVLLVWSLREGFVGLADSDTAGSAKKSGYEDILKSIGQTVDYAVAPGTPTCDAGFAFEGGKCKKYTLPTCTSGSTFDSASGKCVHSTTHAKTDPTCAAGTYDSTHTMCAETRDPLPAATPAAASTSASTAVAAPVAPAAPAARAATTPAARAPPPPKPAVAATPPSRTSSTTTGGSTNAMGPNNVTPNQPGRSVWGPIFSGLGASGARNGDSSKTNKYPTLLGPNPEPSTRIDGVGVVNPSQNYQLTLGGLPSSAGLGSDENSQFLPYSRTPGDQDLIPDPYRVAKTFSAANYASRHEPSPFLTDFAAFQK